MRTNRARCQQDQTKLGVSRFPFTQNRLRDLADQRQADGGCIIQLHIHERFDQLALIDPHEVPGFRAQSYQMRMYASISSVEP